MLVDSSNSAANSAVTGAIRQASQNTGTSFNYLLATAQVESGLNALAGAATSSAKGLFQFIQQTWLATMKQAGPALGYGRYADAITQTASGQYQVSDPALRNEILNLRTDPAANAAMAGAFTQSNAAALSDRLGRSPSEGELYIAHFLGAGNAARLINLAASNPNAKAADIFPEAAQANSPIFYDRATGAARTAAQVRNILTARYELALKTQGQPAGAPTVTAKLPRASRGTTATARPPQSAPDTAGIANAFAAATPPRPARDEQVFHGLFADRNRTAPLAPVVSALWGVPSATASGSCFAHARNWAPAACSICLRTCRSRARDGEETMIVRHFLDWVRTAPAGQRAEATGALARAYLYSDLSPDDAAAAEGALLMLLDDASPLVRRALADTLAASEHAPPAIVLALAADQPQIAAPVLALSPLFVDADLVDAIATGGGISAGRDRKPRRPATRRSPQPLPKSARPNPVWCFWKTATPKSRRSRSIGSSNVMVIWRRSASRCWSVKISRRRHG